MVSEVFDAAGATFVRNASAPLVRDMNHIRDVRVRSEAEIGTLFRRIDEEFQASPHRRFDLPPWATPAFEARLLLDGYRCETELLMVLEGELRARPQAH